MFRKDIEINAEKIKHLLFEKGKLSLSDISSSTNYSITAIHSALGWLCREKKIKFTHTENDIQVELDSSYSEIFY